MSLRMALPLVFCIERTSYFGRTTERINQTVRIEFRAGKNTRESAAVGNCTHGPLDVHEIVAKKLKANWTRRWSGFRFRVAKDADNYLCSSARFPVCISMILPSRATKVQAAASENTHRNTTVVRSPDSRTSLPRDAATWRKCAFAGSAGAPTRARRHALSAIVYTSYQPYVQINATATDAASPILMPVRSFMAYRGACQPETVAFHPS